MADDIHEVVYTDSKIDALPEGASSSDVWRALHGDPTEAVAAAAVRRAREGGGGANTYTQRASYTGDPVSVPDNPAGAPELLTWDSLGSGAALLDLTDPTLPEVITEGIYAVTAVAHAAEVLSAGATFVAHLHLDFMGDDAVCEMTSNDQGTGASIEAMVSLACTYYIPAGGVIALTVLLDDGTAARDFNLREAMIQRLS